MTSDSSSSARRGTLADTKTPSDPFITSTQLKDHRSRRNDATATEVSEMNRHCETVVGQDTITSLINVGVKESKSPWNVIVFAGSWVRGNVYRKFDAFVKSRKDILFPVVDGHYNFVDGSMNGIIIHKETFSEVGDFSTHNMQKEGHNDLELIKLWWSLGALEKGCVFKAIIGMKVV
jgi:hypothetical protein